MTKQGLKQREPKLYAEVYNLGIEKERIRVAKWLPLGKTNLKECKQGIASGNEITKDALFWNEVDMKLAEKN